MLKKVNPQLFRIKKYNFINSPQTNFFDSLDQFYTIKRNIFFLLNILKNLNFLFFILNYNVIFLKLLNYFFLVII